MHPLTVEIGRAGRVESAHQVAAAVVDTQGGVVLRAGDIEAAHYPRSAVKAMLALPLVESGAADRLGLDNAALALACASHAGEPAHVAVARAMLACAGRDEAVLSCGAHPPFSREAAAGLIRAGFSPCPLHNNCSGKHAGLVCLAVGAGLDPEGYAAPGHPAMRVATASLERVFGVRCGDANRAIDGCGIPTYAMGLAALAGGFARFGVAKGAAARLRAAVAAHPDLLGGAGRFDTVLTEQLGARVFTKGGAEGVWCAAIPEAGLGIAVKAIDGAGRAAEAAIAALIGRFLPGGEAVAVLGERAGPVLRNWVGTETGRIRVVGVG